MPAADDLLVASRAETGHPERHSDEPSGRDTHRAGRYGPWLVWMSELLKGTHALAVVCIDEAGSASISTQTPAAALIPDAALALACRAAARGSRQRLVAPGTQEVLLALPLPANNETSGVSTVLLLLNGALSQQQQSTLLGLAGWALKSAQWCHDPKSSTLPLFMRPVDTSSDPLDTTQLMDQLGRDYPGSSCALHWMKVHRRGKRKSRVMAVSGQSKIDRTGAAVRAMAEQVDALYATGSLLPVYDVSAEPASTTDEQGLDRIAEQNAPSTDSFMIPVCAGGELLVVSVQGGCVKALSHVDREQLAEALVPAVQSAWLQHEHSLGVLALLGRRARKWQHRYFQGGAKRCAQGALSGLILLGLLWPVEKRLSADVIVEAAERHALIAPLDGYVKSVQARAGDRVEKGQLLASLDDQQLQLEVDKWTVEEQKNQQEYLSALALHDRVELSSLRENQAMIQTELDQVRAQLARHELRAPVAGIVLSDTVEDALGSAVKAGKILFEVGSAEQYRLALQVPERRISEVEPGQYLNLRMTADPKRRNRAQVDMIIPVAVASQGENTFKVYASALQRDDGLRPGMKGVGKILVGRESRLMQWWDSLWTRVVWLAWKFGLVA